MQKEQGQGLQNDASTEKEQATGLYPNATSSADEDSDSEFSEDSTLHSSVYTSTPSSQSSFGRLHVRIVSTAQIDSEHKKIESPCSRATAMTLTFGTQQKQHFWQQTNTSQTLTMALKTIGKHNGPKDVSMSNDAFTFDVTDTFTDLRIVVYQAGMLRRKKAIGQIVLPFESLLSERDDNDSWFELFPVPALHKFRPAIPTIANSGLQFPRHSLGFVRILWHMDLDIGREWLWVKQFASHENLMKQRTDDSKRKRWQNVQSSLETASRVHRNMFRISHASHTSQTLYGRFIRHIRSWEAPLHSVLFSFLLVYVTVIAPLWQIPLICSLSLTMTSYLSSDLVKLTCNWKSIKPKHRHPGLHPTSKSTHEYRVLEFKADPKQSKSALASSASMASQVSPGPGRLDHLQTSTTASISKARMHVGNWIHRIRKEKSGTVLASHQDRAKDVLDSSEGFQQSINKSTPSKDLQAQTAQEEPFHEDHMFHRHEDSTLVQRHLKHGESGDFLIWNEQVVQKSWNVLEKSARAAAEMSWLDAHLIRMAENLERGLSVFCCEDERASFAIYVVLVCSGAGISATLFLLSTYPFVFRSILSLMLLHRCALPPEVAGLVQPCLFATNGGEPVKALRNGMKSSWMRVPTLDELGHRFIASNQRITFRQTPQEL
mmetsp:Transcript_10136/g.18623  ORF Transcript_10136/g.18623 Transcript_10136/m.18623 type:complete len:660 (+) Transcript_10136:285-2264(+)